MSLKLPNDKIVYNLPEQVGVNAENIKYLAEVYKEIDSIPGRYAELKQDNEDTMQGYANTMGGYATTMQGYATTMGNYSLTMQGYANTMGGYATTMQGYASQVNTWTNNIAAAAVSAINGQNITPASVAAPSIQETGLSASFSKVNSTIGQLITYTYCGVSKIGNIVKFVISGSITTGESGLAKDAYNSIANFTIPTSIGSKIVALVGDNFERKDFYFFRNTTNTDLLRQQISWNKASNTGVNIYIYIREAVPANSTHYFRSELTVLLSENLVS